MVSPESCVRVGAETAMKNAKGEKVTFHMLTFPYKVLEDVARNFQLSEQPSAPENINQLISSVGFYFHEEVEIKVKKDRQGVQGHGLQDHHPERQRGTVTKGWTAWR